MASVFVVSDRSEWSLSFSARLCEARSVVVTGNDALSAPHANACDVAILDLDLRLRPPLEVCAELRSYMPVLAVHAGAHNVLLLPAYEAGADVVVPDDIGIYELLSRIRALVRHRKARSGADPSARAAMTFDPATRSVLVEGGVVSLTQREYEALTMLARTPGRVVTRQELTATWTTAARLDRSLDFVIRCLRTKLESVDHPERIVVVRGYGYRLVPDRTAGR